MSTEKQKSKDREHGLRSKCGENVGLNCRDTRVCVFYHRKDFPYFLEIGADKEILCTQLKANRY